MIFAKASKVTPSSDIIASEFMMMQVIDSLFITAYRVTTLKRIMATSVIASANT